MDLDVRRLPEVAARYGTLLILQFGSTVRGAAQAHSDLDLAVLLRRPAESFGQCADLAHDLQLLAPDREVDLAIINRADPLFLKKITENCRLLHGDPTRLHELRVYAFKRYQDHRKYLALERQYVARVLSGPS